MPVRGYVLDLEGVAVSGCGPGFITESGVEGVRGICKFLEGHGLFANDVGIRVLTLEFFTHFGVLNVNEGGAERPDAAELPACGGHIENEFLLERILRVEVLPGVFE
jgi:hypothetical protein